MYTPNAVTYLVYERQFILAPGGLALGRVDAQCAETPVQVAHHLVQLS